MRPLSLLILVVAPAGLLGQEAHQLKFKKDWGRGSTCLVEKREIVKTRSKLVAIKGKDPVEDNQQSKVVVHQYRETILEKGLADKEPTRLRRTYEVHQLRQGDETTSLPLHGKSVIIEKTDEKYRFRFEGGAELSPREAEDLIDEFQNPSRPRLDLDELLTEDVVEVQRTYKINPKVLVKVFAPVVGPTMIDDNQPKGDYTLTRAYKKDGKQYGVLDVRIHLPVQQLISFVRKPSVERLFTQPGAAMRIRLTADGCIDGSAVDMTTKTNLSVEGTGLLPTRENPTHHLLVSVEAASDVTRQEPRK